MADDSTRRKGPVTSDGYVVPISGLLAFLFALMAGGSAYPAFTSGSIGAMTLPVIFGAVSLLFLRVRQRSLEARGE